MSFSGLALADLAPENQKLALQNAANPANPANLIDLKGNALANLLLIPANPLLIDTPAPPATPEISNRLANFSKRLANEESLIADEKQADTARLAELATLAASEKPKNAFTSQYAADLAIQNEQSIKGAAIPASPAIRDASDCFDSAIQQPPVAIPLLFDAIPLLFGTDQLSTPIENSSKIATNSSRIANEEWLKIDKDQRPTEKIAGIAKIAASETAQKAITPQQAAALTVLQTLYTRCVAHLVDGGHDGKGALVHRRDYWRALHQAGIDTDTVCDLLDHGWIRTQAEGLYWWPVGGEA